MKYLYAFALYVFIPCISLLTFSLLSLANQLHTAAKFACKDDAIQIGQSFDSIEKIMGKLTVKNENERIYEVPGLTKITNKAFSQHFSEQVITFEFSPEMELTRKHTSSVVSQFDTNELNPDYWLGFLLDLYLKLLPPFLIALCLLFFVKKKLHHRENTKFSSS